MKNVKFFRVLIFAIITALVVFFAASCKKDNSTNNNSGVYELSGNASGSQEVPPDTASATATFSGTYNADSNMLHYTINWTGLSGVATSVNFQGPAAIGVSAGILSGLTISSNGIMGTASGTINVADSVKTALLSGNVYYNIYTTAYPAGEIRGQVEVNAKN